MISIKLLMGENKDEATICIGTDVAIVGGMREDDLF